MDSITGIHSLRVLQKSLILYNCKWLRVFGNEIHQNIIDFFSFQQLAVVCEKDDIAGLCVDENAVRLQ